MRSATRRDLFPAIFATGLVGVAASGLAKPETLTAAPVAKPEGNPDAHLIALCDEWEAIHNKTEILNIKCNKLNNKCVKTEIEWSDSLDKEDDIIDFIKLIRPHTKIGFIKKSKAIRTVIARFRMPGEPMNFDEELSDALIEDAIFITSQKAAT